MSSKRELWAAAERAITLAKYYVETAILATPTSETRNLLTEANLKLMQADEQLQREEVKDVPM